MPLPLIQQPAAGTMNTGTTGRRLRRSVIVLAMAFALASACRDIDVVTASYGTRAEAEQAGAVAKGWLPAGTPASAHDIREAHDPDTSRRWGLFNFNPADAETLRSMLRPDEVTLNGLSCDIPARVEWWPVLLRGALDHEKLKAANLKTYRSTEGDLTVVVNWAQGRAYYWGD